MVHKNKETKLNVDDWKIVIGLFCRLKFEPGHPENVQLYNKTWKS